MIVLSIQIWRFVKDFERVHYKWSKLCRVLLRIKLSVKLYQVKIHVTWKSLKECGSCEAFLFVSNVIFVLHLWCVKAVKPFLVFLFVEQMKDMLKLWRLFYLSICFSWHLKICWSCDVFSICIFVFFFITFERYAEPVKPFLFVYLFFKTFQTYAEAGFSSFSFPPPGNLPLTLDPGLPLQNCRSQKYSQNK